MVITSNSNFWVKHLVRLREDKGYRKEIGDVVVSGIKLVRELARAYPLKSLIVQEGTSFDLPAERTEEVSPTVMKKVTGLVSPEPVAAEVMAPKPSDVSAVSKLLVLDQLSDPGNLGTLLRTALALGWDGVFLVEGCVDLFNDKALRSSKGAPFFLPFQIGSYDELNLLLEKRGGSCFVADMQGLEKVEAKGPVTLILGNEAHGVSEKLKKEFERITISMSGKMESLNVAVAGGILMSRL